MPALALLTGCRGFMIQLITGLVSGTLTAAVAIILIEKMIPSIRRLLIGHYVITDIAGTYLSYCILPVVGLATMISAATFCLLFTIYLFIRRNTKDYTTIYQLMKGSGNGTPPSNNRI